MFVVALTRWTLLMLLYLAWVAKIHTDESKQARARDWKLCSSIIFTSFRFSLSYLNALRKEKKSSETYVAQITHLFLNLLSLYGWHSSVAVYSRRLGQISTPAEFYRLPAWQLWERALAEQYQLKLEDSHVNGAFLSKERWIFVGASEFISINIDPISLKAKYSLSFASSLSKIESWPSILHQLVLQDESY